MTQKEVLLRLCQLFGKLQEAKYHYEVATDCFCGQSAPVNMKVRSSFSLLDMDSFRFDEAPLKFVEEACQEKLSREHGPDQTSI